MSEEHGLEKEMRLLSFVPRWSIVKTNRLQNIAEHSFHVAVIAWRMVEDCGLRKIPGVNMENVFKEALTHDLEETVSADIPSPVNRHVKANCPGWKAWLQGKVQSFFPWFVENPLAETKLIVSVADLLEATLFLMEEEEMGNRFVTPHRESLEEALRQRLEVLRFDGDNWGLNLRVKAWVNATIEKARTPAKVLGDFRSPPHEQTKPLVPAL